MATPLSKYFKANNMQRTWDKVFDVGKHVACIKRKKHGAKYGRQEIRKLCAALGVAGTLIYEYGQVHEVYGQDQARVRSNPNMNPKIAVLLVRKLNDQQRRVVEGLVAQKKMTAEEVRKEIRKRYRK